jgi:hypothetical protein
LPFAETKVPSPRSGRRAETVSDADESSLQFPAEGHMFGEHLAGQFQASTNTT